MKRFLSFIGRILVSLFIIVTLYNLIIFQTSEQLTTPSIFGYSMLVVVGESMEETFSDKDAIIIKKQRSYQEGDVITFYHSVDGSINRITHRIIEINEDEKIYITMGDKYKSLQSDQVATEEVDFDDVVGKVVVVIPWLGNLLSLSILQNKGLILTLLIIFSLLTLFLYILILKDKRRAKRGY